MAGPPKKKAAQQENNAGAQQVQEEIQIDFEGRNPEADDYYGIRQLLGQLFLKAHIDLSQVSDMLIAQQGVGSVLKQSEDDMDEDDDDMESSQMDVYGITSVLNISAHKDTTCAQQLLALLEETTAEHADETTKDQIKALLTGGAKIGLLINERFVNIPAKISDPLLSSLLDEITRRAKKNDSFNFDYYIMICKLHKPKNEGGEIVFSNGEEEIFDREACLKYEFDVSSESDTSVLGKWTGDVEMIPYRRVLFINANNFSKIVESVKEYVA